ncbi:hypothetical protein E4U42_004513, partial [Claviceps africana]
MRTALGLSLLWLPLSAAIASTGNEPGHGHGHYQLKSSMARAPPEWERQHRAHPGQVVDVAIGLAQPGFAAVEEKLLQVSSPQHANYGRHLSSREVQELLRPAPESVRAVRQWLAELEPLRDAAMTASATGDWLELTMPVGCLEKLLRTEYWVFKHAASGAFAIRSLAWSLPTHLADMIEVVTPSNVFLGPTPQLKYGAPPPAWEMEGRLPTHDELVQEDRLDRGRLEVPSQDGLSADPTAAEACNRLAISPLCLRVLYGTWGYTPRGRAPAASSSSSSSSSRAARTHSIGIVNFLGEVANRSDVALYLARYRPDAAAAHAETDFAVELVHGGDDQQTRNTPEQMARKKGYEGALDAQTVLGISWPAPLVTYNVGGTPPFRPLSMHTNNTNEPYLAWLRHMRGVEHPPAVISISYAEDEKLVPPEYARRVCAEFAQLGLRGVSVLVASGDWGVGRDEQCVSADEERRRFMPSFPASCPYVTAVGATRLIPRGRDAKPGTGQEPEGEMMETVAFDARSRYASGGGFSDVFAQPRYQRDAVAAYLAGADADAESYDGLFDRGGRAYPDMSAAGYHFSVLWDAVAHLQDGTSA